MTAAELLLRSLAQAGITTCFANPGTTEMPLVEAFDTPCQIRPVLCLFEGVATGAADGYARMTGLPGLTLLHLGPGYANGIANLHNARRARTPVINLIGDHATWHRCADAPLAMPVDRLCAAVPGWVRSIEDPGHLTEDVAAAFAAAMDGRIANLLFPHDMQLAPLDHPIAPLPVPTRQQPDPDTVTAAAKQIFSAKKTALLLGGNALTKEGLLAASVICGKTGCHLFMETFPARVERGEGIPAPERIPYLPESALERLQHFDSIILCGMPAPVAFFGYPGIPGRLIREDQKIVALAPPRSDAAGALFSLAEELGATQQDKLPPTPLFQAEIREARLDATTMGPVVAARQPENAIIVDEGITSGFFYHPCAATSRPHTTLSITGGAIGFGLPCATGAAMACPDRPVIALQADGSAMYTIQALWTQAREQRNITTVLCANNAYDILNLEVIRAGNAKPGPMTRSMTDLANPAIGWVGLSESLGVPAREVTTTTELAAALTDSLTEPGPHLIVARLCG